MVTGNYFPLPGCGQESHYSIRWVKVNSILPQVELTEQPEVSVSLGNLIKLRGFRSPTGGA